MPAATSSGMATTRPRISAQSSRIVKNIFDERSPTYMQQNRGIGGIEASMTEPRMYGLGIKGTF